MKMNLILLFLISTFCVGHIGCPPVEKKKDKPEGAVEAEDKDPEWLKLEYGKYLREVVQILEGDDEFRRKLESADVEEIRRGDVAKNLELVNHGVRTKLDELKRSEIERLRRMTKKQYELNKGIDRRHLKVPTHLDIKNPQTFEVDDLKQLIVQTTRDLEAADEERREDFKKYEMEKEFKRAQELKQLNEEERKKAEEKHNDSVKRHKDHPKLHHPGAKAQLEEVWDKQDHMEQQKFDPKLFFRLHDLDDDGMWSRNEVKALFKRELDKMYDPNNPEDDPVEREEEMERMREHVFNESDIDRDGSISYDEFLMQTRKSEFEQDEEWKAVEDQEIFTDEDYRAYAAQREAEVQRALAAGQPLPGYPHIPPGQYGYGQPPVMPVHPNAVPQGVPIHQGVPPPGGYHGSPGQGIPPPGYHGAPGQGVPPAGYHGAPGIHHPPQGVNPGAYQPQGRPYQPQPNAVPPQHQPNAVPPQHQPNAVPPQHQPNAVPPHQQPNAIPAQHLETNKIGHHEQPPSEHDQQSQSPNQNQPPVQINQQAQQQQGKPVVQQQGADAGVQNNQL